MELTSGRGDRRVIHRLQQRVTEEDAGKEKAPWESRRGKPPGSGAQGRLAKAADVEDDTRKMQIQQVKRGREESAPLRQQHV